MITDGIADKIDGQDKRPRGCILGALKNVKRHLRTKGFTRLFVRFLLSLAEGFFVFLYRGNLAKRL